MYARSTTFRGTPSAVDDGISYIRNKVMPAVEQLEGYVGLSLLAERATGRCIVTTSWADRQALRNSSPGVMTMRQHAAETMGGPAGVQEWEVALMHRLHTAHHGASARVVWSDGDAAEIDRMVDTFRMTELTRLEDVPGCCSVSVMVDRRSGGSTVTTTYDSPLDMRASRNHAMQMRRDFMAALNRRIIEVAEFELVVAELRIPETV